MAAAPCPGGLLPTLRLHHALTLVPRLGLVQPRGKVGSSWPGYALPGDAVYCLALVVEATASHLTRDPLRFAAGAIQHWR